MSYLPTIKSCGSVLICLVLANSGQIVWADEDIDQTRTVDPTGTVKIHNPRGDLEIHGWDRSEVQVEGDLDDLAESVQFEVDGKFTLIRVALPTSNVNWGDGSDLNIYVPHASRLQVDGVSADIEVEDVSGAIAIRTVSGDVEVSGIGSNTRIETVSGDVDVDDRTGRLSVVTTSGDLDLDIDADDVFVDTMSGDVDLQLGSFTKLAAESVSGSLKIAGNLNQAGSIQAKTVNADIDLELTAPVNAHIQAMAVVEGGISNALTDDQPKRMHSRQTILKTVSGDGSAQIALNTISGEINIK